MVISDQNIISLYVYKMLRYRNLKVLYDGMFEQTTILVKRSGLTIFI